MYDLLWQYPARIEPIGVDDANADAAAKQRDIPDLLATVELLAATSARELGVVASALELKVIASSQQNS